MSATTTADITPSSEPSMNATPVSAVPLAVTREDKEPPLPPAMPPAPPSAALPPAGPAAPETFLQRAQQDYKRCRTIVNNLKATIALSGLPDGAFPKSRRYMVDLLARRVEAAERSNYDDELYVAYQTLAEMMRGWYFADNLKAIINATLAAINDGRVVRQPLRYPARRNLAPSAPVDSQQLLALQTQNASLELALEAKTREAAAAAVRHVQELKVKSDEVLAKDKQISELMGKLDKAVGALNKAEQRFNEFLKSQAPRSSGRGARFFGDGGPRSAEREFRRKRGKPKASRSERPRTAGSPTLSS